MPLTTSTRMYRKQKLVVSLLVLPCVLLAIFVGVSIYRELGRSTFAENLILRKEFRSESFWTVRETPGGYLLRVKNGRFKNWYLASDDLVNTFTIPARAGYSPGLSRRQTGPCVRNVILRQKKSADCYWKVTQTKQGYRMRAAHGRYEDWQLEFLEDYIPDSGNPPSAWNLILREEPDTGLFWTWRQTPDGLLIQAASQGRFDGWYLDCLLEAKILERSVRGGAAERRDGPSPPLAGAGRSGD